MFSLLSVSDYVSVPALVLPNVTMDMLAAEAGSLQNASSSLPLRLPAATSPPAPPAKEHPQPSPKRAASASNLQLKQKLRRSSSTAALTPGSPERSCPPISLTHRDCEALAWMVTVLEEVPDPWISEVRPQLRALAECTAVSAAPGPGPHIKVKSALQNGFLFGRLIECLEHVSLQGLANQPEAPVAYNNWSKALSILRANVHIDPTHLFIERDLVRVGHDFVRLFLPLLHSVRETHSKRAAAPSFKLRLDERVVERPAPNDEPNLCVQNLASGSAANSISTLQAAAPDSPSDSLHRSLTDTYAPSSRVLQQMRADMTIAHPVGRENWQQDIMHWLEWLSLEPPIFQLSAARPLIVSAALVHNPWCNGKCFHKLLARIYSVLVVDHRALVLPFPDPQTQAQCTQNNNFILRFAEYCGISCAYSLLADDFLKPERCKFTVWALLSAIVQRFPLCDTLNLSQGDPSSPFSPHPYNPLQYSVLEKSLSHWVFTLGFLHDPPYSIMDVPVFDALIPHMRSGRLFVDLSLAALRMRVFSHIPKKVSYNYLQRCERSPSASGASSGRHALSESDHDVCRGLQLFLAQDDMNKALFTATKTMSLPRVLAEMMRYQLVLLLEDIHRCWDRVPSRLKDAVPYAPYAPLSFKLDAVDMTLLARSASERLPGESNTVSGVFSGMAHEADNNVWKMEAPFVRPPDEILVGTSIIVPSVWFLPEVRGYPMNYSSESEIVPLYTPDTRYVEPY